MQMWVVQHACHPFSQRHCHFTVLWLHYNRSWWWVVLKWNKYSNEYGNTTLHLLDHVSKVVIIINIDFASKCSEKTISPLLLRYTQLSSAQFSVSLFDKVIELVASHWAKWSVTGTHLYKPSSRLRWLSWFGFHRHQLSRTRSESISCNVLVGRRLIKESTTRTKKKSFQQQFRTTPSILLWSSQPERKFTYWLNWMTTIIRFIFTSNLIK